MSATIVLVGNLKEEPRLLKGSSEVHYLPLSVCHNQYYKKKETPVWFEVTFFLEDAERISKLKLQKGEQVLIRGDLVIDSYTNPETGKVTHKNIISDPVLKTLRKGKKKDAGGQAAQKPEPDNGGDEMYLDDEPF